MMHINFVSDVLFVAEQAGHTCAATSGLGPSSSSRRANEPAVLKFFSCVEREGGNESESCYFGGCIQWVDGVCGAIP